MAGEKGSYNLYIKSNDGLESQQAIQGYFGSVISAETLKIVDTGLYYYFSNYDTWIPLYVYTGRRKFKGLATMANAKEPTYPVGTTFTIGPLANDDNVNVDVVFFIVEDHSSMEVAISELDLSAGTHKITVKARANGYEDSPASDAVSYTLVSGTWYFDEDMDVINNNDPAKQQVNFVSNGVSYTDIGSTGDHTLFYYKGDTAVRVCVDDLGVDVGENVGWLNEVYRTITFDGVQTVSKEFYDWLVAHAVFAFTIDGTTYYAKEGMTWSEWVASEYNTGRFYVYPTGNQIWDAVGYVGTKDGVSVLPSDIIIGNGYSVTNMQGGGIN